MKEVRSQAEVTPSPDPDTYSSDGDNWESDDTATVTSMSLPPTPVSLNNKYSFSASSLIDTDSSHFDSKDPDTQPPKTFFGVTLRKASRSSPVHVYTRKQDSMSDETSCADHREMDTRRLSSTSLMSVGQVRTPSSTEEDTPAPATLRQSTIIKVDTNPHFTSSTSKDSSPVKKFTKSLSLANIYQHEDLSPLSSPSKQQQSIMGYAFAPKGKKSMTNFLRAYTKQKSLHDIHQFDEKAEESFSIQIPDDDYIQHRFQNQRNPPSSLPSTLRKAKSEKSLTSIDNVSNNTHYTNINVSSKTAQPHEKINRPISVNGSMQEELPLKNTNTTTTLEDFVDTNVALVTTLNQDTLINEENTAHMEKSIPEVATHSEENESSLECDQNDKYVTASVVYCTGEDPSEIVLNEAHVSLLQEHLKKESPPSLDESSSDSGHTSSEGRPMRRHKSVGDLLKEYSNMTTLDRKKNSKSIVSLKNKSGGESSEPYKTIIAVEHNPTQTSPKVPRTSQGNTSSLVRPKPKAAPSVVEKSLSHSYFKNVDQESGNSETVINVSDRTSTGDGSDGEVFHASTIYVGDGKSDSQPDYSTRITVNGRVSPTFKGEVKVNDKYVNVQPQPQPQPQPFLPVGCHGSMTSKEKVERNKDINDTPDSMITTVKVNDPFSGIKGEKATDSSHIKIVSVTEKVNPVDHFADIEQDNPITIKELIMKESRTGKSGFSEKSLARKQKIKDATVPLNSPFSPLRSQHRKKSSSSLSPSEEVPPKLANQDSQDEGVDLPSDTTPSASSQEPGGPEGCQPRV